MARVVAELSVCVDCLAIAANGELGQGDTKADEAHAEAMSSQLMGDAPWLVPACPEDCEGWFSWSRCDGCGSTLGGDRHPAAIVR